MSAKLNKNEGVCIILFQVANLQDRRPTNLLNGSGNRTFPYQFFNIGLIDHIHEMVSFLFDAVTTNLTLIKNKVKLFSRFKIRTESKIA